MKWKYFITVAVFLEALRKENRDGFAHLFSLGDEGDGLVGMSNNPYHIHD